MTVDEKLDLLLQKVTAADSHLERIEEKMSSMDDQVTVILSKNSMLTTVLLTSK